MHRYLIFFHISNLLLRLIQALSVIFIFFSSFSYSSFLHLCCHYFKAFSSAVANPIFVFLLGNAIVLFLFSISSGDPVSHSRKNTFSDVDEAEFYKVEPAVEEVKQIIWVENPCSHSDDEIIKDLHKAVEAEEEEVPEEGRRGWGGKKRRIMRKKKRRRRDDEKVEELSNEGFRQAVEAFIEKNRTFMREESMAMAEK